MSEVPADARNPEPKPQPASATPRFVLSCFGGEGVFLDLARGNLFLTDARQLLLWAAPHVLALSGHAVLHAAAVEASDGVVAFCGSSGRGKTTLASLLADQGMPLVAEDLLVLTWDGAVPQVF